MKDRSEAIYDVITELADVDLQRKYWLNENNDTGYISSYVELMCTLFDDLDFDEFVDNSEEKRGLSYSAVCELVKLRDMLNNYQEKGEDREIIEDPKWKEIVNQAKEVVKKWRNK